MKRPIRVIKVGGRPQSDPRLASALAAACQKSESASLVLVHGGGDEVSTLQSALGVSTSFVDGRRVTTERDVDIVRMALSGSANKRLVAALVTCGVDAIGISGEDAALVGATPSADRRLGFVGSPTSINVRLVHHLLIGGFLPVISPVSRDASGTLGAALNVNGDDAAAAIGIAIGADELLLVADVEGVMCDGGVVAELTPASARHLIANGTAAGGMRPKLEAALAAVAGGVASARISDLAAIEDRTRGTILRAHGDAA
ncbi:MAG TPA: acetylglutamate kinase [Gemmatimonadaceae bacterium]|jgi:acetylglutamate kinase|nr:acetylglutamate kinase [Gemmatimonadaceae bacterium]